MLRGVIWVILYLEIVKLYEKKLKELNPTVVKITYDVKDLNNYIDHLTDLCALV